MVTFLVVVGILLILLVIALLLCVVIDGKHREEAFQKSLEKEKSNAQEL